MLDPHSTQHSDIESLDHTKSKLILAALQDFIIPASLSIELDRYYLLHWQGPYLHSIQTFGRIYRENIEYLLIYKDGLKPSELPFTPQVKVSFRKLREFSYGYALVARKTESPK